MYDLQHIENISSFCIYFLAGYVVKIRLNCIPVFAYNLFAFVNFHLFGIKWPRVYLPNVLTRVCLFALVDWWPYMSVIERKVDGVVG